MTPADACLDRGRRRSAASLRNAWSSGKPRVTTTPSTATGRHATMSGFVGGFMLSAATIAGQRREELVEAVGLCAAGADGRLRRRDVGQPRVGLRRAGDGPSRAGAVGPRRSGGRRRRRRGRRPAAASVSDDRLASEWPSVPAARARGRRSVPVAGGGGRFVGVGSWQRRSVPAAGAPASASRPRDAAATGPAPPNRASSSWKRRPPSRRGWVDGGEAPGGRRERGWIVPASAPASLADR